MEKEPNPKLKILQINHSGKDDSIYVEVLRSKFNEFFYFFISFN